MIRLTAPALLALTALLMMGQGDCQPCTDSDGDGLCDDVDPCPASPGECVACEAIPPSGDAALNVERIQGCLDGGGLARLEPGAFPVSRGIVVPDGAQLLGNDTSWPSITLTASATNYVVSVRGGARVGFLTLDGGNRLPLSSNSAVVHLTADGGAVDNNHIRNGAAPTAVDNTGVYFICADCAGNNVVNNQIYNHKFGVIFQAQLDADEANTLENNRIYNNKCDGVTLVGFGRVIDNQIYQNGYDCENGPIPGGAIYSLWNTKGAEIVGNSLENSCGNNLDLDGVARFLIQDNVSTNPGYTWGGAYPYCNGQAAILVDSSDNTLEGNVFENNGRPNNRVGAFGDPNQLFHATGAPAYSDLPHGADQTIAFLLARRPNAPTAYTTGNVLRGNAMRAACSSGQGCVGLGYFSSRWTGYGAGDAWLPNFYTENDPNGSQVGSKRCGGNWYAADSACPGDASCNTDDPQHDPPVGDWARNDGCNFY